jgi:hypothetical protein
MAHTISRGDLWHSKMEMNPLALQNIESQAWPKINTMLMTNIDSLQATNSLVFHYTDYIKTHSSLKQRSNVMETWRGPKIPSKFMYD